MREWSIITEMPIIRTELEKYSAQMEKQALIGSAITTVGKALTAPIGKFVAKRVAPPIAKTLVRPIGAVGKWAINNPKKALTTGVLGGLFATQTGFDSARATYQGAKRMVGDLNPNKDKGLSTY